MATSQWYPGLGWTVRNGMSHLLVGFVAVRTTDGSSCSLLSVGLIPPRGGVVYINNYRLAVVHRFKAPENIHLEKEEGRRKEELRCVRTVQRPSISWHQEASPTCAGTGHTSSRRLVIAARAGRWGAEDRLASQPGLQGRASVCNGSRSRRWTMAGRR